MKIALVGIGKIARDQHIPAITASPDWELAATVSWNDSTVEGVPSFARIEEMLDARPDIDVVSICLPPAPRFPAAEAALLAGRHLMLEKPPGATLTEVETLAAMARERGLTLYTAWHSREAASVAAAAKWLAGRTVHSGRITWHEDVRHWHPGQDWLFEPAGMGVFDPGINMLSVLTAILPRPVHLTAVELDFPANRQAPIATRLTFTGDIHADVDMLHAGPPVWDMEFETDAGPIALRMGGNLLEIGGKPAGGADTIMGEYPALYARLAELVRAGASDVDLRPLTLVADAFMLGRRNIVDPFAFDP